MSETSTASVAAAAPSRPVFQEDCIPVKIFNKYVEVMSNSGASKFVSLNEFLSMISAVSGVIREEEPLLLPVNTYAVIRGPESMKIAMYHPEVRRSIQHNDDTYEISWPNTVLVLSLKMNERDGSWIKGHASYFCTPKSLGELNGFIPSAHSADQGIYRMPFPNFYENYEMCYGGNTMPVSFPKSDVRGLKYYYDVIFVSPFNNDLGVRGFRDVDEPRDLFRTLRDNPTFPYERLR